MSVDTDRRRMLTLALLGVLLGGVGGFAAYLIVNLVGLISNLSFFGRIAFDLPSLRHFHPHPSLIGIAIGGGLVVALLAVWSPVIKGHGLPESMEAIVSKESRIKPRAAFAKPVSAAIAMGTGGPFGAEGPIIVTGGAVGSLLGQIFSVTADERKILLATGAAAGMAGVFNTPVAAVILAFELLLFERSIRALLPLVLATGVAAELHRVLIGTGPLFRMNHPPSIPPAQLWLFAVLGLAVGLLAVLLNKGLFATENLYRKLPVPEFVHPVIGAAGYALIGFAVPGSLSVGYWAIRLAFNGHFLLVAALVLFVGKTISWWVGLASNTSGGTLAPMFLIGATMGLMVGDGFRSALPGMHLVPAAFALVAMGATFGVGARAPLTGVVFAAEVTGGWKLLIPLLIATGVAEVLAEQFLDDRIMTDKLFHRGFRIDLDVEADPLRARNARQVMVPAADGAPAPTDVPHISPWAFAGDAWRLMVESDLERVPVAADGRLLGYVDRTAINDLYRRRWDATRVQPGWLAQLRRRRRGPDDRPDGGDRRTGSADGNAAYAGAATNVEGPGAAGDIEDVVAPGDVGDGAGGTRDGAGGTRDGAGGTRDGDATPGTAAVDATANGDGAARRPDRREGGRPGPEAGTDAHSQ